MQTETLAEGVTLYCGDSMEMLLSLPRGAIVSDPPYGRDYNHSGGNRRGKVGVTQAAKERGSPKIANDDRPFDPAPWLKFDNVLLWGADHFYPRLPDCGRWLAWNKLGEFEPWDSFSDVEFAWHSAESAARILSLLWKGIACTKKSEDGVHRGQRHHPTQKPVRLMAWSIEEAARGGDTSLVIDPYMGAGITGVAAVMLNRHFIGIEIEQRWFDIACRRIGAVLAQPQLFTEPPPLAAMQLNMWESLP